MLVASLASLGNGLPVPSAPMQVPFVDLGRQYASIKDEVDAALLEAVGSMQYILGEEVARFEREFAEYCEAAECVGVASGTAAIQLALEALEIGPEDEVIAPANTFIASILPVLRLGARPVLVDCDPRTATIDAEHAAAAITPRTKALVAVHLYGHPADLDALGRLCDAHGIALVEDACQAHGARLRGRRVGGLGRVAAFSFYPAKNLGAYGDGGAVTTNDPELAQRVRLLRDLGQRAKYDFAVQGVNERLDTIHAAVLRVKLRRLDEWNELRRAHAAAYAEALDGAGLELPEPAPWAEPVWHLYVVRLRNGSRDALREALAERGIATSLHYPRPLHLEPVLASLGYGPGDFPVSERWCERLLSLPMFPELEAAEISYVARAIAESSR
jgi:dTDP-4-amino-4,6-dideoxygalactose transaminase